MDTRQRWLVLSGRPDDEASRSKNSEGYIRKKDLGPWSRGIHGEIVRDLSSDEIIAISRIWGALLCSVVCSLNLPLAEPNQRWSPASVGDVHCLPLLPGQATWPWWLQPVCWIFTEPFLFSWSPWLPSSLWSGITLWPNMNIKLMSSYLLAEDFWTAIGSGWSGKCSRFSYYSWEGC